MATELPDPDEESCLEIIAEAEKEFGPFEPEYRKQFLQDLLKHTKEMRTYLEETEPDPFWIAHHEAKRLEQCGEWQSALAIYTELLATEGWPIEWYFLTWQDVSKVQFLLNNLAESLTAAQEATRCFRSPDFDGPPLEDPLLGETFLLLRNGRVEEAAERIQEAASPTHVGLGNIMPTRFISILYLEGMIAVESGDLSKAEGILTSLKQIADERFSETPLFTLQLDIQTRIRSLSARRLAKLQDFSAAADTWKEALDLYKPYLTNREEIQEFPYLRLQAGEIAFQLYEALKMCGRTEDASEAWAEHKRLREECNLPPLA